ncbi:hypothetical protein JAAARDRAFT_29812 [Jaapia argillacea MUCL 33604]|uniref:Tubulin-tyrosine ligase n=1 Tax=Jaapia argillacea MUCL 33604 TaxID=933084 RepID=A0A067QMA5_9AGAM|nr:hypothetical protein JAAARDRAFT_29812 [Jaapia argillacea MUCL 33604]
MSSTTAFVSWPSAPLTDSLVRKALSCLSLPIHTTSTPTPSPLPSNLLQWSTYDSISHELTLSHPSSSLSSSYIIRKALIRKHFLSRTIHSYTTKHPDDEGAKLLKQGVPRTWEVEICWADELEEAWMLELYQLGIELDMNLEESEEKRKWWILKPGMADRGMGIRLFDSKGRLQEIFEEFEEQDDDGDEGEDKEDVQEDDQEDHDTSIVASQLRHFVIQEYIDTPLLLSPPSVPRPPTPSLTGHKFHLRAYVVASGALTLYLSNHILALFSSSPYSHPSPSFSSSTDDGVNKGQEMARHLTNTCLQPGQGEEYVRLLDELVGWSVIGDADGEGKVLTPEDVESVKVRMGKVLAETFKAALEMPVHFQPLPNAFELFGVDFLLSHHPPSRSTSAPQQNSSPWRISLLELNAEPAIEMTGPRLRWILEDVFTGVAKVCVGPFFSGVEGEGEGEKWGIGEMREGLRKCLEVEVRGSGGW